MNKLLLALPFLALVACAAPPDDAAASTAADTTTSGRAPVSVTATWTWAVTGVPTIGDPAESPVLTITAEVDDGEVRAHGHPDFDGLEKPFAFIPRADGSSDRVELGYQGTSMEGFIALFPSDNYASDPIWLTAADLALVQKQGITVALDTNVGVIESDNYPVAEKNP